MCWPPCNQPSLLPFFFQFTTAPSFLFSFQLSVCSFLLSSTGLATSRCISQSLQFTCVFFFCGTCDVSLRVDTRFWFPLFQVLVSSPLQRKHFDFFHRCPCLFYYYSFVSVFFSPFFFVVWCVCLRALVRALHVCQIKARSIFNFLCLLERRAFPHRDMHTQTARETHAGGTRLVSRRCDLREFARHFLAPSYYSLLFFISLEVWEADGNF